MSDSIVEQQKAYYRARAAEYDEWFYRKGRYDRGAASNQQWFDETSTVRAALLAGEQVGHVLELACGTGIWTLELLKLAQSITALDASAETIAINRAKVESSADAAVSRVTYTQVDLFAWAPPTQYDMLFAGYWLSHVPPEMLTDHLKTLHRALKPGGRIFMVDGLRTVSSTAKDHVLPETGHIVERKLNDGSRFEIVKVFYDPATLQAELRAAGFDVTVHTTPTHCWYADGVRG